MTPAAARRRLPGAAAGAVAVRPVRASDLDGVIAIDTRVTGIAKQAYWQQIHHRYGTGRSAGRQFLVAAAGDEVVGFVIGEVRDWEFGAPPCGWVFAIDVMPSARQLGIGARMLADLVARFRREGVHTLRTMTSSSNSLLQSFFRSQGMRAGHLLPLEMDLSAYPLEGRGVDDEERAA